MSLTFRRVPSFLKIIFTGKIFDDIDEVKFKRKKFLNMYSVKNEKYYGKIMVSIIIPTRNESHYVTNLLESLRLSNYDPVEIILADYSSTDGTLTLSSSYGVKNVFINQKGVGVASHQGVLNSSGKIIIRTDADAIFHPDLIGNIVKLFEKNSNVKLIHVGHYYYDSGFLINLIATIYDKHWRAPWKTTGQFIAFKREIYDEIIGFNEHKEFDEDFDFGRKVSKKYEILFKASETIFVSSRRVKSTGIMKYLFGKRNRSRT